MNTSMLINALNGIMVDGDFIRIEELDDLTFECDHCGERHLRSGMNEWHDVDGESWCDECFTDDAFICDRCGEAHSIEDVYTVNTRTGTEYYCESCADWYTAICEECGERYETDDMTYLANGNYVCDDCRDEYYSECDECGEWFRTDDMTEVRSGDLVCDGCLDSEYSYCDECCEFVPNSEFDDIQQITPICYVVKKDNLFGVYRIDTKDLVVPINYQSIRFYGGHTILVCKDNLWGALSLVLDTNIFYKLIYKQFLHLRSELFP